jgi:hypothetical protein
VPPGGKPPGGFVQDEPTVDAASALIRRRLACAGGFEPVLKGCEPLTNGLLRQRLAPCLSFERGAHLPPPWVHPALKYQVGPRNAT